MSRFIFRIKPKVSHLGFLNTPSRFHFHISPTLFRKPIGQIPLFRSMSLEPPNEKKSNKKLSVRLLEETSTERKEVHHKYMINNIKELETSLINYGIENIPGFADAYVEISTKDDSGLKINDNTELNSQTLWENLSEESKKTLVSFFATFEATPENLKFYDLVNSKCPDLAVAIFDDLMIYHFVHKGGSGEAFLYVSTGLLTKEFVKSIYDKHKQGTGSKTPEWYSKMMNDWYSFRMKTSVE